MSVGREKTEEQPHSWEAVMHESFLRVKDDGVLNLEGLRGFEERKLSDLVEYDEEGNAHAAPDILDLTTNRVIQAPLHEEFVHDNSAFLGSTNNFFPIFEPSGNLNGVPACWQRFAIVAPQLYGWLAAHESVFHENFVAARQTYDSLYSSNVAVSRDNIGEARDIFPQRGDDHVDALRMAYCIVSQLICEGDRKGDRGEIGIYDTNLLPHLSEYYPRLKHGR